MDWSLSSSERYEEIRAAVADLIEDWGITAYPFSIWSLLKKMGIRTMRYSSLPDHLHNQVKFYWPDASQFTHQTSTRPRRSSSTTENRAKSAFASRLRTNSGTSSLCIREPTRSSTSMRQTYSPTTSSPQLHSCCATRSSTSSLSAMTSRLATAAPGRQWTGLASEPTTVREQKRSTSCAS